MGFCSQLSPLAAPSTASGRSASGASVVRLAGFATLDLRRCIDIEAPARDGEIEMHVLERTGGGVWVLILRA